MNRHFLLLLCSLCLIGYTNNCFAQSLKTFTLKECIDYAQTNNIPLKQSDLQIASAKVEEEAAKSNRLPDISTSYSHGFSFGRSIDPVTNSFETDVIQSGRLSVNSGMVLYNGSIIKNTIKQNQLRYQLAQSQFEDLSNDLSLNILSAYLQILLSQEQVKVLQEQKKLTQQQLERSQKLVRAGVIPKGDLVDIEAQIANDDLNIVNGENNIANNYLTLANILTYYDPFQVVAPTDINIPSSRELAQIKALDIYITALTSQPQIKVADLQSDIAAMGIDIAKGGRYPTVTLGPSLNTNYSSLAVERVELGTISQIPIGTTAGGEIVFTGIDDFEINDLNYFQQLGQNVSFSIGVSISVPIFDRFQTKNNIARAKIGVENAQLNKELVQNNLRAAVERAYLNARSAASRYEASAASIKALQQSLTYAQKRLDLGLISTYDFLTIKNNLTQAELNRESAKYEYFFTLRILDFYQGKPFTF